MDFSPREFSQKSEVFLKETFQKTGFKKALVAVSGGVDSAVSASLTVRALGKENVNFVFLPYGDLNSPGLVNSRELASQLKLAPENIFEINIKTVVDAFVVSEKHRRGNIMARVRMIFLYDLARQLAALVVGTENKSEHYLGYFTRFGDEASDIEPIRSLYKSEVYELARYLGVPASIQKAQPTAGLWVEQSDAAQLGFSYEEADPILQLYCEEKLPANKIIEKGYTPELVEKVISQVEKNKFKLLTPYLNEKI